MARYIAIVEQRAIEYVGEASLGRIAINWRLCDCVSVVWWDNRRVDWDCQG